MSYIETPEDIAKQLEDARARLREFEDDVSSRVLIQRLRNARPYHPAILARLLLFLMIIGLVLATVAAISAPFVAKDLIAPIRVLEAAIGLPLPVATGIATASFIVAYIMATLAAISEGRECDLLPEEARTHAHLSETAARLARQKVVVERIHGAGRDTEASAALRERGLQADAGTPGRPAYLVERPGRGGRTPLPSPRRGGESGTAELLRGSSMPPGFIGRTPTPAPSDLRRRGSPLGASTRGGTPLGAAPRRHGSPLGLSEGGTPLGSSPPTAKRDPSPIPWVREDDPSYTQPNEASGSYSQLDPYPAQDPYKDQGTYGQPEAYPQQPEAYAQQPDPYRDQPDPYGEQPDPYGQQPDPYGEPDNLSYGAPTGEHYCDPDPTPVVPEADALSTETSWSDLDTQVDTYAITDTPDIVDSAPGGYVSHTPHASAGSTDIPHWGRVDEPWLEDAIQKAETLAEGFPIQAHLEFSNEPGLPFTLVLQRATPAMAVRAMVSYVEFLASISTPPRARVVLRSVPHLDRSFHRNVQAALEPYFPGTAEVTAGSGRVDITFVQPDADWSEYPDLPITG